MTKKLNSLWFLEDPIDLEQKEYILLNFLKIKTKDLNQDNCISIIKEISSLIKILKIFKEGRIEKIISNLQLGKENEKIIEKFKKKKLTEEEVENIKLIVSQSLQTLYDFSEICMEILKEEESKIKIFKIQSKFDPEKNKENFGFLIMRNMITDDLLNYFYKSNVKMKTKNGENEVVLLKKIHIENSIFSMSYEHIYHELLNSFKMNTAGFPEFYVVEIYENFDEDSEIFKISKDKFFEIISEVSQRKV